MLLHREPRRQYPQLAQHQHQEEEEEQHQQEEQHQHKVAYKQATRLE